MSEALRRWLGALLCGVLLAACGSAEEGELEPLTADTTTSTRETRSAPVDEGPSDTNPGAASGLPGFGVPRHPDDPLAAYAPTSATTTLLVSTWGDDESDDRLVVIDLEDQSTTPLEIDRPPHSALAVDADSVWYVTSEGGIGNVGWDGEPTDDRRVGPVDAEGVPVGLWPASDGALMVGVGPGPGSGAGFDEVLLLERDGSARCRFAPVRYPWLVPGTGVVHAFEGGAIDTADCARIPAPDGHTEARPLAALADGTVLWESGDATIVRSTREGAVVADRHLGAGADGWSMGIAVDDTSAWVVVGTAVVQLEVGSLEPEARWVEVMECGATSYVIDTHGAALLVSDCDGLLRRLDSGSAAIEAWPFPHDDRSDQEIYGTAADDGVWFVDLEQTGEPYFFNPRLERFEAIPIDLRSDTIFALDFFVRPGT